jgi:ABC-type phosphate transport system substrate-binding protein
MINLRIAFLVSAFVLTLNASSFAAEVNGDTILVIVNAQNPVQSLTLDQVKGLYRNYVRYWPNGEIVHLYDMGLESGARNRFSEAVLHQDPSVFERDWVEKKMVNEWLSIREKVHSPVIMQIQVAKNPGAIGYVLKRDLKTKDVRVVATIE